VAGTLRFAKPSTCVLDLANLRVEGGDTWICQIKHLGADDADSWVSVENTNQNDCWQV